MSLNEGKNGGVDESPESNKQYYKRKGITLKFGRGLENTMVHHALRGCGCGRGGGCRL